MRGNERDSMNLPDRPRLGKIAGASEAAVIAGRCAKAPGECVVPSVTERDSIPSAGRATRRRASPATAGEFDPTRPLPRRRKTMRRAEILAAARRVFLQRGFDRASISEIAAVAGCSEGTLYTYFRGKRAIFDAVLADFYDRLIEDIGPEFSALKGTRDRLVFLVSRHMRIAVDEPAFGRLIIAETWGHRPYRGSKLHALNRQYSRFLMTALTDGIASGDLRADLDPAMARDMIFGTIEHWVWNALTRREPFMPAQVASTMVGMLLDGWSGAADEASVSALARRVRRLERRVGAEQEARK